MFMLGKYGSIRKFSSIVVLVLALVVFPRISVAQNVSLSWNAPTTDQGGGPLTGLAGYKLHYGNSAGNYSVVTDVGNVTSYNLTLAPGTYFFAVTAYDPNLNQSGFSNEVSRVIQSGTQNPNGNGTSDSDQDGISNLNDNCPLISNADQIDTNQNGKGDACEGKRTNTCRLSEDGQSVVPLLFGTELKLISADDGSTLAQALVARRSKSMLGDIDGAESASAGFGNLDIVSLSPKMLWSASTISGQKKQRFGQGGSKAMLCNVDGDAALDYAVLNDNRFIAKSSKNSQKISVKLKGLGEIKAVLCSDFGQGSSVDQLIVVHKSNRKGARKQSRGLSISVLDINSKAIIETRQIDVTRFSSQAIADINGDGVVELCTLQSGKNKSVVTCADTAGSNQYELPFKATRIVGGDFLAQEDGEAALDELAILTPDGRIFILANGNLVRELSGLNSNSKGKALLADCR